MILAIHHPQDVTLFLIEGLQRLQEKYGQSDWASLVSQKGVIRQNSGSVQQLSTWLSNSPASNAIVVSNSKNSVTPHPKVQANKALGIVFEGRLDNASSIMRDLLELGYELIFEIHQEIVLTLLTHYLKRGLCPFEAMRLLFMRAQGRFAVMGLFGCCEKPLLVGSRGYPLALGVSSDSAIVSFDLPILKPLYQTVIKLDEADPMLLGVTI
jgi:glucosamine 6-phosphate synthetase-like amidotransferase/phosphosugar isomerase protein